MISMNNIKFYQLKNQVFNLLPLWMKNVISYVRAGNRIPIQGIPDGIDYEKLNEICFEYLMDEINTVSYLQISSWKPTGSYRLRIQTRSGVNWSLVFRNAEYNLNQISALDGLPIIPGPSEYLVYKNSDCALAEYLPKVYLCREVIPGVKFQYVLEDLNHGYRMISKGGTQTLFQAVLKLPEIHIAMEEWANIVGRDRLPQYNKDFSASLQVYAKKSLEKYYTKTFDKLVAEVLRHWPSICNVHECSEFSEKLGLSPIHGDFNTSNLWLQKKRPRRLKIVDWEWAGLGLPHADLASLLVWSSKEIERKALETYYKLTEELSFAQHWNIYQWCKMERAILDGSFIAAQYLKSSYPTRFNLPKYIQHAMYRLLHAHHELSRLCLS
jgi:hypothetical protein